MSRAHHPATNRPARLALSLPDSGSSGIIDVGDLRADPTPLSLSPPGTSSPPARPTTSRWPLAGLLTAAAASLTMIALAVVARPEPTVVVQQTPAPMVPELAMLEAPEPEVHTAVQHDAPPSETRAEASAGEGTTEPTAAETNATETNADDRSSSKTKTKRSKTKRSSKSKSKTPTKSKSKTSASIPVECVLDPSRCTTSGKPKASSSSSGSSPKARPAKLSASQLKSALASTKADARRCRPEHGADSGTRVQVKLSIEGRTGRVVSSTPQGAHAGDALGRCVARALSRTQFPEFTSPRMGTLYSVRL